MSDLDERAWWVFRMPEATVYVPAQTEAKARNALASNSYKGAPVDSWPLKWTRICSRQALARELLTPRSLPSESKEQDHE